MAKDVILTSLHGRRFGLTSTGGLGANETGSTGLVIALMKSTADIVQGAYGSTVETAAVVATTMINYGMSVLSTATATAATYTLAAPVKGVEKQIYAACSASEITIQGTATSILFGSTGGDKLFFSAASNQSNAVMLKGISSTRWAVLARPTAVTITGG
jgi:hypothetical protein